MKHWLMAGAAALLPTMALAATPPAAPAAMPTSAEVDRLLAAPLMVPQDVAAVTARCDATLALAGRFQAALEAGTGTATVATVFRPYDDLSNLLHSVPGEIYLVSETNPSKAIREAAEACFQKLNDFTSTLSLSRPIYDRLSAIPKAGLAADTRFILQRELLQYRLAGVDKDAATRAKIDALRKTITATGLKFEGNIRDLKGDTALASADDLAGMPEDYVAAHKPGPDGKIHISTDYPDTLPILDYADKESTRKAVYLTFINRAWPANTAVLKELLAERAQLAGLLGYPNYAGLALADKMIATPEHAVTFLNEVDTAATPGADKDYAELLARWRRIDPAAAALTRWNASYVTRLVRKERYDVDSAVVRQYFTYAKARDGVFQLAHDLFGADIRPWATPVWNKDVTAWALYDKGRLVGRFYLDPHPREGKFTHAAQFPIREGVEGRAVPEGALVTNFPATGPMDHDDVQTFLHEFGHLLHSLYSAHHPWSLDGMDNVEWDFVEAPSQFLEEWTWDYDTLARFATNAQGQPIPADLVARMNTARKFAQGIDAKTQIAYSAISLDYYTKPPASVDLDGDWKATMTRYSVYPYIPGTHMWANFGHLNGYSAYYYTYVWSKAIALDLFTRFQKAGLRDPATAMAYRHAVLEQGSSKPADAMIRDFLGRPFNLDAYKARLEGK